jgi:hypothetical protein
VTKVAVTHPALVPLVGVTKIAVSQFDGDCGADLTDRLTELVSNSRKFEVLDRVNLQKVLAEQDFHFTGRVDDATAARLGKILGPTALVFGRVSYCKTVVTTGLVESDSRGRVVNYVSKTKGNVTASIQLVELTTGRVLKEKNYDGLAERVNRNPNGPPEAPDEHVVQLAALASWINQASHLLLPWNETVEFKIHNDDPSDKTWSLKHAADLMKTGQFEPAAAEFKSVVDQHQKDDSPDADKYMPKALYDLGIALTYAGRPNEGIKALQDSNLRHPDARITEAIDKARSIASLQQEVALLELKGRAAAAPPPPAPPPPASAPPPSAGNAASAAPAPVSSISVAGSTSAPSVGAGLTRSQAQKQIDDLKAQRVSGAITPADFDAKRTAILARCAECGGR